MSSQNRSGAPTDVYAELLNREISRGERISWIFRWEVYGVVFALAAFVLVVQKDVIGLYGMILTGVALLYNLLITTFVRRERTDIWIRYTSVTLDMLMLTVYNGIDAHIHSALVPVTTATLLLFPILIYLASLRQDRRLIIYTTVLAAVCMNVLFAISWPHFDRRIAALLVCGDVLGEVYRTAYILLFGFLMLNIPRNIDRLLSSQKRMIDHNLENFQKAHHDVLTGLANRRLLMDFMAKMIPLSRRNKTRFAVIYLDLDGFKPINDELGHDAGDEVLAEVARRILSAVRESDLVARVGGDEFVAVALEADGRVGAEVVAQRILAAIRIPMIVQGRTFPVGASLGIAMHPEHGTDGEELLRVADAAMYAVKKAGKNGIGFG